MLNPLRIQIRHEGIRLDHLAIGTNTQTIDIRAMFVKIEFVTRGSPSGPGGPWLTRQGVSYR
jgi:hypothetical protein